MKNNWGVKITAKDPGGKKRKEKTQNLEGEKVRGAACVLHKITNPSREKKMSHLLWKMRGRRRIWVTDKGVKRRHLGHRIPCGCGSGRGALGPRQRWAAAALGALPL